MIRSWGPDEEVMIRTMTAVHRAHEKVGWSAKAVITLDLESEVGDVTGVAIVNVRGLPYERCG